jgi:hypothetical protein
VVGRLPEKFLRGGVHQRDAHAAVQLDDGVHGAVDEPAQFLLPLPEVLFETQPAHLRNSAVREDLEQTYESLLGGHRPHVDNRDMAEDPPVHGEQGRSQVADDRRMGKTLRHARIEADDLVRDVDEPRLLDRHLAGRPRKRVLVAFNPSAAEPERESAKALGGLVVLGHPCAMGIESVREVFREEPIELRPRPRRRSLDDGAERSFLVESPHARE